MSKWRIRTNGQRFIVEERGLLWGWNNITPPQTLEIRNWSVVVPSFETRAEAEKLIEDYRKYESAIIPEWRPL